MSLTINLTETPDTVTWPEMHYVFLEKVGTFQQTAPAAWTEFHELRESVAAHNTITGFMSLYQMGPQIYRAGVSVSAPPRDLPAGLRYEKFPGGKYARFVLTGPYMQLGPATCRACELVAAQRIALREGFNIEHYVTDPRITPEPELITEILFPTA